MHKVLYIMLGVVASLNSEAGLRAMDDSLLLLGKKVRDAEKVKIGDDTLTFPAYEYAELRITNMLSKDIVLKYTVDVQQCFVPIVRRKSGEVVSTGQTFGISASLMFPERSISIAPAKSYQIDLGHPWETVPTQNRIPGAYYFRVQFHHDGKIWESNEIEINYK